MKAVCSLFCFLVLSLSLHAKTIHIKQKSNLNEFLKYTNATYVINEEFNLNGSTLRLPLNSTLSFGTMGKISNGTIIGNNTIIKASPQRIFENIEIEGLWKNDRVYSQWFQFKDGQIANNDVFSNLMQLCKGKQFTHFYMQKGTYYVSAIYRSAPILVPSNVYWHNEATIKMLPTDDEWYNIVYINKSNNVTIEGGAFLGDVEKHKRSTGEWGHGIKCGGATNIVIKNLTCSHCWGDGIDLIEGLDDSKKPTINCNNITIDNVKCLYNRRQGISIEAASNVKICNSEFAFTGIPKYTSPCAGLDIEPWTDNNNKVWNVTIENCKFHDNKGLDVQCEPNVKKLVAFTNLYNNILFSKCEIGSMRIQYTKGVIMKNCDIKKVLLVQWVDEVELRKTTIEKFKKGSNTKNIKIVNSKINSKSGFMAIVIPLVGFSMLTLMGLAKYKQVI